MLTIITPHYAVGAQQSTDLREMLDGLSQGHYQIGRVGDEIFIHDAPFVVDGKMFNVTFGIFSSDLLARLLCERAADGALQNYCKTSAGNFALEMFTVFAATSNELVSTRGERYLKSGEIRK